MVGPTIATGMLKRNSSGWYVLPQAVSDESHDALVLYSPCKAFGKRKSFGTPSLKAVHAATCAKVVFRTHRV